VKGATRAAGSPRPDGRAARPASRPTPPRAAIERSTAALFRIQAEDGHWCGELQGDTILESEYIFLMAFLGREHEDRALRAARYILSQQLPHGGWSNYSDGPPDINVSVKAYFALKLTGVGDLDSPAMRRARDVILALGGAAGCNSFTKFYLALLGQFPYDNCPAVPPELILLPRWCYFNLYAMSAWTRTIVVPLSIFYAHKPCRRVSPEQGIRELFLRPPETPLWPHPPSRRLLSWPNLFLGLDWLVKKLDRLSLFAPIRRRALRKAVAWMRDHFSDSDGVGAIFPPMIYTVICLKCIGVPDDDPEMQWALKQLDDLILEGDDGSIRLQPCFSPVWDTALALNALADSSRAIFDWRFSIADLPEGTNPIPRPLPRPGEGEKANGLNGTNGQSKINNRKSKIAKAVRWLLDHEVRRPGDWSLTNPGQEPAGWFFEYRNGHYPDTDDTAMVLMALARTGHACTPDGRAAAERGLRWLLGMQNQDGGWAAFDRDINREVLTKVPFADHNAMLDPSCPDITARVLEALGCYGYGPDHPQVKKALAFIESTQEETGCWPGRWGVNYIYGTWQVLTGLGSIGHDMRSKMVRRAVAWLCSVQQAGGGWGESCASYDNPTLAGQGTPTASQTAWALLGLLAAGEAASETVRSGIDYLNRTQRPDGTWHEEQFTGTGFPKVFYLKYHLYSLYFPLMALARYQTEVRGQKSAVRSQESAARNQQSADSDDDPGIAWVSPSGFASYYDPDTDSDS
jgi:squalene-hopene/tetraprenyl-beta-curcumene cyclase